MPGYGSKIYDSVLYIHSVTLQNIDTNAPLFGADNNSVLLPINDGNCGDTQLTFDMMLPQNELFTSDVAYNSGANSMTVGIANEDQVDIATIQIETTDSAKNIYVISENDLAEKSKNLLYTGEISGETLTYSIALDWRAKTYTVTIKNGETDLVTESGPYNINNFASVNGTALGKYMKITHSVYSQCMMSVIDNIVFEYSEDASYIECKEDALSIELGTEKIESDFITLPLAGDNGTAINWASSDSAISVDNETGFATITRQSDDITVTLTATVSKDGMSYVRDIDVIVAEHEDSLAAKEDAAAIILDIPENGIVSENFTLPIQGSVNNSVISWVSNDAAIEINENTAIVVRSENEKEVVLTAFVTAGTKNATRNFIIKVASLSGVFAEITNISETVTDNKLTATMTVSYPAIEGNITFVAVSTDENTGTVLDRKTDTKVINSDNKYASVNFTITDLSKPTGSTVSYFLWDDNDVSIVNNAPSPVKNLTSVGKVKGVGLTWDNSEDDYNALSYDIYRDGEYIGSSDTNKYLDTSAENGAVYDYSVFPVDRNELAGDSDDTRNSGELPIMYYIDINARESGSSDFRYGMEDSVAMFLSDPAREIYSFTSRVTDGNGETFFVGTSTVKAVPFKALATAISGSDKELVLEIEYLDTTGSFNVAYNGIVPEGQNDSYIHALRKATSITMTNTRQWKTAVVRINDANLRGGSHCSGMHFQIQCSNAPSNVFIRKFSVIQADLYD